MEGFVGELAFGTVGTIQMSGGNKNFRGRGNSRKRSIGEGVNMVYISPTRDAAESVMPQRERLGTQWRGPLDTPREPLGFDLLQDCQQVDWEVVARSLAGQSLEDSGEARQPGPVGGRRPHLHLVIRLAFEIRKQVNYKLCWETVMFSLPSGNDSPGFEACQHFFGFR